MHAEPGQSWPGHDAGMPAYVQIEPGAGPGRPGSPNDHSRANRRMTAAARKLRDFHMLAFGGKHATRHLGRAYHSGTLRARPVMAWSFRTYA